MNKTFILLGLLFITVPILAINNTCPAFTDSTCNTCRRIANCTSCGTANGRQVCTACATDFYPNALSSACVRGCKQATGETKCTACQYDESLVRTKCTACIDGNGINTLNQCVSCSIDNCASCKVDDNGNQTCNTCKVGSVKSSDSKTCKACSSNCGKCSSDAATCINCINTGFYINETVCVECSKLTGNCANCTSTQCTTCATEYALSSDNKCFNAINKCSDQKTADGTCKTCYQNFVLSTDKKQCTPGNVTNCEYYTTNTNDCINCTTTYYLIPATTTPVAAAASCGKCMADCRSCDNATTCNYCDFRFFYDATAKKCTPCTANCDQCSSLATCEFCADGYYGANCTQCPASLANCVDCSDATTCTLCKDGFWSDGKTCLAKNISNCRHQDAADICWECDKGYLRSLNNGDACVACGNVIPGCADCYWNSDYIYNPLVCYICKSGYTLVNQVCVPCPFGCSNCNITTVNSANTILDEGLVLAEVKNQYSAYTQAISCQVCASGLHAVDGTCLACPVYCNNCSYSIHNQTGDYPQMGVSLSCQSCAAGTVLVDGTCLPCPVYCNNCSYSIHNITGVYPQMNVSLSCQSCAAGYTLSTDGANSGVCIKEKSSISSYLIFGLLQIIAIAFFLI